MARVGIVAGRFAAALTLAGVAGLGAAPVVFASPQRLSSTGGLAGCPAKAPISEPSSAPDLAQMLVPPGARSVVLCRYHGLNPPALAGRLELERTVSSDVTVARLRSQLDALPAQGNGVVHCPMDDGSEILAIFAYAHTQPDPVEIGLSGCLLVSNGHLTRTASLPPGPALLAELARLL